MNQPIPRRTFFVVLGLCAFAIGQAQINFDSAYFVNNAGVRTDCFIRNVDWKNNPTRFEYRLRPEGDTHTALISHVKEFKVDGEAKYIRAKVKINRSTDDTNALDTNKKIIYSEEVLFLKTLSEGDAVLYYYEEKNLRRFFFKITDSAIEQLLYKRYRTTEKVISYGDLRPVEKIGSLNTYKQQLWNSLKCKNISRAQVNALKYNLGDLVALFEKYNACIDPNYVKTSPTYLKPQYNVSIRPGIRWSSLSISNSNSIFRNVDFNPKTGIRLGVEIEAILPYNRQKWSVLLEPTYRAYKESTQTRPLGQFSNTTLDVDTDYTSIEIPLGIRHYMLISSKSKVFINGIYLVDIPLNSTVTFGSPDNTELNIGTNGGFAIGVGYNHNNKISLEARYQAPREILGNDNVSSYRSDYSGFSVIFGYNIF